MKSPMSKLMVMPMPSMLARLSWTGQRRREPARAFGHRYRRARLFSEI